MARREKHATKKSETEIACSIERGQFCPGSSRLRSSQASKPSARKQAYSFSAASTSSTT